MYKIYHTGGWYFSAISLLFVNNFVEGLSDFSKFKLYLCFIAIKKPFMPGYFDIYVRILFLITFVVIFYLAYRYLKPFRVHRKRAVSTLSLKLSYLAYLALFLYFLFFVLFFQVKDGLSEIPDDDLIIRLYFIAVVTISVLPNLGIVFRRRFKASRTNYNVAVAILNTLICVLLILFILFDHIVLL